VTWDVHRNRWVRVGVGFVVLAFCAAPVPGDVGGCSQRAQELDTAAFFEIKGSIDCEKCTACAIESETCARACRGEGNASLPRGCVALVHDGEVCLRALLDASCEDYEGFVRDQAPTTPTECNFCPRSVP
jgi:hypothetical protein